MSDGNSRFVKMPDGTRLLVQSKTRGGVGLHCLLLHGTGDARHVWNELCDALEGVANCVTVDLRGHGDSDRSASGRYDLHTYTTDIRCLIEQLAIRPLILMGHSLGGQLAVRVGATMAQPSISGMVLVDICSRPSPIGMNQAAENLSRQMREYATVEEYQGVLLSTRPLLTAERAFNIARSALSKYDGRFRLKVDPAIIHGEPSSGAPEEWDTLLQAIRCPAVLIRGRASAVVSASSAHQTTKLLPYGSLIQIDRAGHCVMSDNPEEFHAAVRTFLLGLKAGAASRFRSG